MKRILLIVILIALAGCQKECYEPKKELTKAQLQELFRSKLIMERKK